MCIVALHVHTVCVWAVSNREIARDLTWNRLLLSSLVCLWYILSAWTQQEARRACLVHLVANVVTDKMATLYANLCAYIYRL